MGGELLVLLVVLLRGARLSERLPEMVGGQVNEVDGTEPLEPRVMHEPSHRSERDATEQIGTEKTPAQGWLLLVLREVRGHGRNAQGIVHGE